MNCRIATAIICSIVAVSSAQAGTITNLGVVGTTYPIAESDILAELRGQVAKNNHARKQWCEQIKTYQPADLHNLPLATTDRTFQVDMTYSLNRDLTDADGKLIYPKGYTFNPLDYINFPGCILVIDGADPEQVAWFKQTPYAENHQVKLLITEGMAPELIQTLQRPVFYLTEDIAKRLQLQAVPSLIFQREKMMHVQEIKLSDEQQQGPDDEK
ncbi:hypothetical protein [Desulfogranum marinum]|uniref:hypothetical protein n=1 Tax=Desulfogranum marinum TaxID=453220 RepID=UPI0029C6EA3D|nr:hypothetical protein [Desulfogranum marinum]